MTKFNPARQGDYVIFCDICGQKCWKSTTKVQHVYTGRGGTLACQDCADPIDFGIVPYTIRAEKPVPIAKNSIPPKSYPFPAFNSAMMDPLVATPTSWKNFIQNGLDWNAITDDWSTITTDWSAPNYGEDPGE